MSRRWLLPEIDSDSFARDEGFTDFSDHQRLLKHPSDAASDCRVTEKVIQSSTRSAGLTRYICRDR